MAEQKLNIYQKLSAITSELMTVAKNLDVGVGAAKYKAVGEADVLRAVKPIEAKYGVYSYPFKRTIIESGEIETANGRKNLFERIEVVYRFVNIENPSEYIDITSYGDGIDSQDKSVGKAMTYADKYALLKAYKITTGEDPDQNASEELKGAKIKKEPLKPELLTQCETLNISLENLAKYYKKNVEDLTNADVEAAVKRKQVALKKKESANNGTTNI